MWGQGVKRPWNSTFLAFFRGNPELDFESLVVTGTFLPEVPVDTEYRVIESSTVSNALEKDI